MLVSPWVRIFLSFQHFVRAHAATTQLIDNPGVDLISGQGKKRVRSIQTPHQVQVALSDVFHVEHGPLPFSHETVQTRLVRRRLSYILDLFRGSKECAHADLTTSR